MTATIARVQTADRLINQLQQNIQATLNKQFSGIGGTFVGTFSGFAGGPQTATFTWQLATASGQATINLPNFSATSNSTSMMVTGGMPSLLWPITTQNVLCRVINDGTVGLGFAVFQSSGVINFSPDIEANVFTDSGSKGLASCSVTYIVGY